MTIDHKEAKDRELEPREPATGEQGIYNPVDESRLTPEQLQAELAEGLKFANRVASLSEIALQIDKADSPQNVIDTIGKEIVYLVDHECAYLALLNPDGKRYTVKTLPSLADSWELDGEEFSLNDGMAGWAITHRRFISVLLDDAPSSHPAMEEEMKAIDMRHILAIPLLTDDRVIGALVLARGGNLPYHSREISIAQLLVLQTAIALKNRQLLSDTSKRVTQIEMVNEIAEKLTSTLELEDLLSSAAETIRRMFNYFDVTIFMVEKEADELLMVAHAGEYESFVPRGYRQKLSDGIVGWVARHGALVRANDVRKDARYLAYELHHTQSELTVPIRSEGTVVGVVNVEDTKLDAFDDTDEKVLETVCDQLGAMIRNATLYDELRKTNATLTELDQMKSDFLGIVSHDFRTPLASIILAAKAMVKHGPAMEEQRQKEYLRIIVDQAEKLKALAEDTLSITRHERGQLAYHFELVNVERLIKDAGALVQVSRRHSIEYEVDQNAAYINGDQTKLRQLVHNLLSNAVKYSPRGGRITVTARPHPGGQVMISVSDEGIGIPSEQMNRLFKKFSRVDTTEAKEIKGAGLGLWICHEIVKGHGGNIWVESETGRGSTFRVTLNTEHEGTQGRD